MGDYIRDLEYQLELMRKCGPAIAPKEAARVLDELAHGVASGEIRPDEIQSKRTLFSSLAHEMKDSPELLEAFKWAGYFLFVKKRKPTKRDDGSTDMEAILYGHRYWDAKQSIVRAECGFLEPYLTIQLSELQAILENYGMLKSKTKPELNSSL